MTQPTDSIVETLQAAATEARQTAHAPYSRFKVGAAVLSEDGRVFPGCNVENAAYPLGTCAEAVALGAMIVAGATKCTHILIIGGEGDLTPCGGCRQRIAELAGPDCIIYSLAADGTGLKSWTLATLLPHAFDLNP